MSLLDAWLPPDLANQVASEEPLRFEALVRCLQDDWQRNKDAMAMFKWLSLLQP